MDESNFTIGIVGGTGQMGQWFARFFENAGHRVLVSGRHSGTPARDLPGKCDAVVLSVPVGPALDLAAELGPHLSHGQLLSDFCSLKEEVCRAMVASTRAEVVGTHPLFGPGAANLAGQNVVLCPCRGEVWLGRLARLFAAHGATVTVSEAAAHDRHMAVVQGLNHFVTVVLGRVLERLGERPEDLARFATPVFRMRMGLVARLFAQDPALYQDLVRKNPHAPRVLAALRETVDEVSAAFSQPENGEVAELMAEVREHFAPVLDRGLAETNACLDYLVGLGSAGAEKKRGR